MPGIEKAKRVAVPLLLASATAVYQLVLASEPTNDHFTHLVLAREILHGQFPVRDFYEGGAPLMELLSAAGEALVGYRLLAEGAIVAAAVFVASLATYWAAYQVTGSMVTAGWASLLILLAGVRSYSHSKLVVYAIAATLFLRYTERPTRTRAAVIGAWIGVSFLWRHDYGVYVAVATTALMFVAHGLSSIASRRVLTAAAVAITVTAPYFVWVEVHRGVLQYFRDGTQLTQGIFRGNAPSWPEWPITRFEDAFALIPRSAFAPAITVRWKPGATLEERLRVIDAHDLIPVGDIHTDVMVARLMNPQQSAIRSLVNDPGVADTGGIVRGASQLESGVWPTLDRWRFEIPLLRVAVFPAFADRFVAGQAATALFWTIPLVAVLLSVRTPRNHAKGIVALAVLSLVAYRGLLRTPFEEYGPDVVVLPAILSAFVLHRLWQVGTWGRVPSRMLSMGLALVLGLSVASIGHFWSRATWLAGNARSLETVSATWRGAAARLVASPPVSFWFGHPAGVTVRIARYLHGCTPPDRPIMVVGFAPEIYYYADRGVGSLHHIFVPGAWTGIAEQRASIARMHVERPSVVVANTELYEGAFRTRHGEIAKEIEDAFDRAGRLVADDADYTLLRARDLQPGPVDADLGWPCFTARDVQLPESDTSP